MERFLLQTPIKVKYRVHPNILKITWPIIEVKLSRRTISLPQSLYALIDSGANSSILHPVVAEVLGFNLKSLGTAQKGLSASGKYKSWTLPELIDVDIYGYVFKINFVVIDNQNLIWPCILGEDSIFEIARLDFQKFKGYFEIRFRTDIH